MYWLNMKRIVHCFCSDSNYWDQFHTQRIPQKLCSSGNLRHERSPNNGLIAISSPFSNHLPKKAKFQCCYNWRNKVLPTLVIPLFLFPQVSIAFTKVNLQRSQEKVTNLTRRYISVSPVFLTLAIRFNAQESFLEILLINLCHSFLVYFNEKKVFLLNV